MNDERQILEQIENKLRLIFGKITVIHSLQISNDALFLGRRVDLMLRFEIEGRQKEIIVEVKKNVIQRLFEIFAYKFEKQYRIILKACIL
jgi:hypothetical protein